MSRVKVKGQSKWAQVGETPLLLTYFDPLLGRPEATEKLGLSPDIEQGISNNKKKRKAGWSSVKPQKRGSFHRG